MTKKFFGLVRAQISSIFFLFIVVVYAARQYFSGRLIAMDTNDHYLSFVSGDLDWLQLLTSIRTIGYPLFLRGYFFLFGDYSSIAVAQFLLHLLSSSAFYFALVRFGFPAFGALFAALPIVFLDTLIYNTAADDSFASLISPDSLALSCGLMSISMLFFIHSRSKSSSGIWSFVLWFLLIFFTTLSYHLRPSYLPYILIVPILGAFFQLSKNLCDCGRVEWRKTLKAFMIYIAATFLPFVIYCLIRLIVVGHFGLVSFGGMNIIGMVVPMIKQETVALLSDDVRPLAESILHRVEQTPLRQTPRTHYFDIFGFRVYKDPIFRPNYSDYIWRIGVPSATVLHGQNFIKINSMLTKLSLELIRLYPKEYVRVVVSGFIEALEHVVDRLMLAKITVIFFLLTLLFRLIVGIITCQKKYYAYFDHQLSLLTVIATATFIPLTLLVVLVEPPINRYMESTTVFVQSLIAFFVWNIAYNGFSLLQQRSDRPDK